MVDLAGRKYKDLPHAFGYRKALVQGCACKPVPWSYEEAARHRQYEEVDAIAAAEKGEPDSKPSESRGEPAHSFIAKVADAIDKSEEPKLTNGPALPAKDQISDTALTEEGTAVSDVTMPVESSEPKRIKAEKAVVRRRKFRDMRFVVRKTMFQPTSGSSYSVPSRSKYR